MTTEVYDFISNNYSNSKIIMTKNNKIEFTNIDKSKQTECGIKPKGLWYGIGTSWIDWVKSEMPEWEYDNIFEIIIDESKIFKIKNQLDLYIFNLQFFSTLDKNFKLINWKNVSLVKHGIEIYPYSDIFDIDLLWYRTWDVSSGCIWSEDIIIDIVKIV